MRCTISPAAGMSWIKAQASPPVHDGWKGRVVRQAECVEPHVGAVQAVRCGAGDVGRADAVVPQHADRRRWRRLQALGADVSSIRWRDASTEGQLTTQAGLADYLMMTVFLTITGRLTMTAGRRRTTVVTVF